MYILEKSNYTKVCKQELYKVIFGWQQSAVKVLDFLPIDWLETSGCVEILYVRKMDQIYLCGVFHSKHPSYKDKAKEILSKLTTV